jgi:hypothetical protein
MSNLFLHNDVAAFLPRLFKSMLRENFAGFLA